MKSKIWFEADRVRLEAGSYKCSELTAAQWHVIKKYFKLQLGPNDTLIITYDNLEYLEWCVEKQGKISA